MATIFEWTTPDTIATLMTTELDGLANGSYSAVAAIDNLAGLYTFINYELYLASLTPAANQCVAIYHIPSLDDTNYADGGGAVAPPSEYLAAIITLSTSAGAKRRVVTNILIPPLKINVVVGNITVTSGVAFAANSNTLKYRRHNGQGV